MLEPRVARPESWMSGSCVAWVDSRAPRGAQPKSWAHARGATKVGEIGDEGAVHVLAIRLAEVAVAPLASVWRAI
jgi:hypothetical protein